MVACWPAAYRDGVTCPDPGCCPPRYNVFDDREVPTLANAVVGLFRPGDRIYIHPDRQVDAAIRAAGFEPIHARRGPFWQTAVYRRVAG